MLLADAAVTDLSVMNLILQGGSFAALVLLGIWVVKYLAPKIISMYEEQGEKFDKSLDRVMERHEAQLKRRDESFEKLTSVVERLSARVESLERQHVQ